jgi:multidrug resistance efflux pump
MSASEIPLPDSPESPDAPELPKTNGITNGEDNSAVVRLKDELEQVKADKAALEVQYNTLLAKLTAMRTTVGERLKQDAVRLFPLLSKLGQSLLHVGVKGLFLSSDLTQFSLSFKLNQEELDSRAARITELEETNASLLSSVETFKSELVISHSDLTSAHSELELLRSRALDSQKSANDVELELRELREEFERTKVRSSS